MTLPWMAAKILLRPVAELRAHPGNARMQGNCGHFDKLRGAISTPQ